MILNGMTENGLLERYILIQISNQEEIKDQELRDNTTMVLV